MPDKHIYDSDDRYIGRISDDGPYSSSGSGKMGLKEFFLFSFITGPIVSSLVAGIVCFLLHAGDRTPAAAEASYFALIFWPLWIYWVVGMFAWTYSDTWFTKRLICPFLVLVPVIVVVSLIVWLARR